MANTARISEIKSTDTLSWNLTSRTGKWREAGSTYLIVLLQFGEHDDDAAPLLPYHVPEVPHCVHHWPLGGDEGSLSSFIALRAKEEVSQSTR